MVYTLMTDQFFLSFLHLGHKPRDSAQQSDWTEGWPMGIGLPQEVTNTV